MIKRPLLLVFLASFSLTAFAASDPKAIYQINVVIFKNAQNSGFNSEIWPNSPPQPDFANAVNFIPTNEASSDDSYRLLPAEQSGLKTALQRLNNSGRYKVLTSLSWQQPLTNNSHNAKLLHVFAGKAYAADGSIIDTSDGKIPATWELNGTVKANKSSTYYIDVAANFLLTERVPVMNTDNGGTSTETRLMSFPLDQNIRTRSGEIQYLDHPVYGILVLVTSVKSPS